VATQATDVDIGESGETVNCTAYLRSRCSMSHIGCHWQRAINSACSGTKISDCKLWRQQRNS